jgi:hypothetical protein
MAKKTAFDADKYRDDLVSTFDRVTLDAGLSKRDAAELALDIAGEFKMRAEGLNEEVDADEDE